MSFTTNHPDPAHTTTDPARPHGHINTTAQTPQPTLNPSPKLLSQLLDDLADPNLAIRDVAMHNNISLADLNHFILTHPSVADAQLAAIVRIRLAAATALSDAVTSLTAMFHHYNFEANRLAEPTTERAQRLAAQADGVRRAAHLLLRIANYNPRQIPTAETTPPTTPTTPPGASTPRQMPRECCVQPTTPPSPTPPDGITFEPRETSTATSPSESVPPILVDDHRSAAPDRLLPQQQRHTNNHPSPTRITPALETTPLTIPHDDARRNDPLQACRPPPLPSSFRAESRE